MNTKHAAEYCHWDILEYFISKGGGYSKGFQEVLKWIGHTQKYNSSPDPIAKKLEVLDRLQGYIDGGKVECDERPYKIGNDRNCTLEQVLEKYDSIKNWVISSHPDLEKRAKA